VDVKSLSKDQMIVGGGGIALVVSLFFNWVDSPFSQSAFDAFSGADIILLIVGAAAIIYAGMTAAGSTAQLPSRTAELLSVLGLIAFGMVLFWVLEISVAGFGAWLGLFATLAIAVGAYRANVEGPSYSAPVR
jgi:hypothetical protein